ncbi:MAG: riboflavin biosynthesis protein RibD [Nitrospirae bacterium GWC2_57_9]|nr:MAG: riboflavin biosynthesis protein RibD [Nitrospirae bacterium GWC2_57_9]
MDVDMKYLRMALRLAEKAKGRTSPNPMVGAVVVKSGRVISRGYHEKAGMPHAEAVALRKAGRAAKGATLYVTLEPCSHTNKRTPPCCPLIIQHGIRRVVVAMIDPNPHVSGDGIRKLKAAGIEVITGVLGDEAKQLNEAFVKHVTTRKPFVTLKIAQTLDGKIATASGESQWITGEQARMEGHRLRDSHDAVLVGINTVLNDDPALTTRIPRGRDPVRVIVDSNLRIPLKARVLTQRSAARTIVATVSTAKQKLAALETAGAEILRTKSRQGRVDLQDLMKKLGQRDIMSVLIEGGSEINSSALKAGIVDKVVLFLAPLLMRGKDSICSIGGLCPPRLNQAVRLEDLSVQFVGKDLMVTGYVR